MSKMSPEERQQRRQKVAEEALESVAKTEQFNFRLDAKSIKQLHAVAAKRKIPVGALVRQWVVDALKQEEQNREMMTLILETQQQILNEIRDLKQNA